MTADRPDTGLIPADRLLELDKVCAEFEEQWRCGNQPPVESPWLDRARSDRERAYLLVELLCLEIECRANPDTADLPKECLTRFPDHRQQVEEAFQRVAARQAEEKRPGYEDDQDEHRNVGGGSPARGDCHCSESTPSSLLGRVQAGESRAWFRLVDLFGPSVYRWCRRARLQPADAADVVQEVFSTVAGRIDDFRPGGEFRGWLYTITRNKIGDFLRRTRRQPPAAGGSDAQARFEELAEVMYCPAETENTLETNLVFCRALELVRSEFEERIWKAFWHLAVEGRTCRDVAADLAMTTAAAYKAKTRVLARLREEFCELL